MFKYLKAELGIKDMAGRENDKFDTDLQFASNLKVKFMTPEEYFLTNN